MASTFAPFIQVGLGFWPAFSRCWTVNPLVITGQLLSLDWQGVILKRIKYLKRTITKKLLLEKVRMKLIEFIV